MKISLPTYIKSIKSRNSRIPYFISILCYKYCIRSIYSILRVLPTSIKIPHNFTFMHSQQLHKTRTPLKSAILMTTGTIQKLKLKQNLIKECLYHHQHQRLVEFLLIRSNHKLPIKAYYVFAEANYISCGLGKVMVFLMHMILFRYQIMPKQLMRQ